jgi:hypothetical protein
VRAAWKWALRQSKLLSAWGWGSKMPVPHETDAAGELWRAILDSSHRQMGNDWNDGGTSTKS